MNVLQIAFKNEKVRLWWSLGPVSIAPVFRKVFGLFVNIKSIQLPSVHLKHVLDLVRLTKLLFSKKVYNICLLVVY